MEVYLNKWSLRRATEYFHLSTKSRTTSTVERTRELGIIGGILVQSLDLDQSATEITERLATQNCAV